MKRHIIVLLLIGTSLFSEELEKEELCKNSTEYILKSSAFFYQEDRYQLEKISSIELDKLNEVCNKINQFCLNKDQEEYSKCGLVIIKKIENNIKVINPNRKINID